MFTEAGPLSSCRLGQIACRFWRSVSLILLVCLFFGVCLQEGAPGPVHVSLLIMLPLSVFLCAKVIPVVEGLVYPKEFAAARVIDNECWSERSPFLSEVETVRSQLRKIALEIKAIEEINRPRANSLRKRFKKLYEAATALRYLSQGQKWDEFFAAEFELRPTNTRSSLPELVLEEEY